MSLRSILLQTRLLPSVASTSIAAPLLATVVQRAYASGAADQLLKKTALHDYHVEMGAKMAPFCGWNMPIVYKDATIVQSHLHTRKDVSLFDVSHMGQVRVKGKDSIEFIESLVPGDIRSLAPYTARLTQFLNARGGIEDDTVITRRSDEDLYVVVNAGCAEKDIAHMREYVEKFQKQGRDVRLEIMSEHNSLVAVQGPKAEQILQKYVKADLSKLKFMNGMDAEVASVKDCIVTRCGYTGEDGFEVSIPHKDVVDFTKQLMTHEEVKLAGLGARDSLRLEAGLLLWGQDMTENISPIEAGLLWTIPKWRREQGGFLGAEAIQKQLKEGVSRKRISFIIEKGAPARIHDKIVDEKGTEIGEVTSGTYAASLKKFIGFGYVPTEFFKNEDSKMFAVVRNKQYPITRQKGPFIKPGYKRD